MRIAAISRIAGAGGVAAVLVAALASCATLDEEQCRSVDWQTLGQQDGAAGRPASYIEEHRKACASHKLPVQDAPWHTGWEVGIRLYCTPQNGLTVGRDGGYYANSCPVDLKPGFETAYLVGKRVYEARTALSRAQADLEATMEKRLKAATEAERQALDREVVLGQSAAFAAQTRQLSAEAAYDRYLARLPRG